MTSKLIVLSGLPGTGKTEIAESVAKTLGAPAFAKDWLEAPILQAGTVPKDRLGTIDYDLLTTLTRRQLEFGQSAVLDSVASSASIRHAWRELAHELNASSFVIECVCSDSELHRQRLLARRRGIPGWPELTWAEVERVQSYYVPWQEERLILDSVSSLKENIEKAIAYVARPAASQVQG